MLVQVENAGRAAVIRIANPPVNALSVRAERGGPMFHADRMGLPNVLAKIERFAAGINGWSWTPAPLLVELAARNATFGSLAR